MPNSTPATAIFAMLPWALDDFARVIEHSLHQTPNITISSVAGEQMLPRN
jgi:hypothetical protein